MWQVALLGLASNIIIIIIIIVVVDSNVIISFMILTNKIKKIKQEKIRIKSLKYKFILVERKHFNIHKKINE